LSSHDTLVLISKFVRFALDVGLDKGAPEEEENVIGGFKAILIDSTIPLLFSLVSFSPSDSCILAVQLFGLDVVSPPCNLVVTFRAMPYTGDNSTKLQ
jgi:hypothetical protein